MKLQKNQDGFTLVEVSVGILISSIILLFASGMVLSGSNLFFANTNRSEARQIGDAVFHHISEELTYAKHVQIFPDEATAAGTAVGGHTITVTDGRLHTAAGDVFGEAFYLGRTVTFTATVHTFSELDLSVSVLDKNGTEVYTTTSTINVLNMKLAGEGIEDFSGDALNPYITYEQQGG
ncbi:MAG: prepilin-type N-terminal cleavage/methylation domain-containing protein [Angelakisella sp.]